MSSVNVWQETVHIPTYETGAQDVHPMFLENRVYQGSSGAVYPYGVTDTLSELPVTYTGLLPDLFREGQGVVAEGRFEGMGKVFVADTVLAKHDETYMPKDVADRLKAQGVELSGKEEIQ